MYFFFKKKLEIASEFSPLVSFRIQKRLMPFLISCLQKVFGKCQLLWPFKQAR